MTDEARNLARLYFTLFALLILGGIAIKRDWGHPEFVIFFHLPGAFFLVLGGISMRAGREADYQREIAEWRERAEARQQSASLCLSRSRGGEICGWVNPPSWDRASAPQPDRAPWLAPDLTVNQESVHSHGPAVFLPSSQG